MTGPKREIQLKELPPGLKEQVKGSKRLSAFVKKQATAKTSDDIIDQTTQADESLTQDFDAATEERTPPFPKPIILGGCAYALSSYGLILPGSLVTMLIAHFGEAMLKEVIELLSQKGLSRMAEPISEDDVNLNWLEKQGHIALAAYAAMDNKGEDNDEEIIDIPADMLEGLDAETRLRMEEIGMMVVQHLRPQSQSKGKHEETTEQA